MTKKSYELTLLVPCVLLLSACGGSGGANGPTAAATDNTEEIVEEHRSVDTGRSDNSNDGAAHADEDVEGHKDQYKLMTYNVFMIPVLPPNAMGTPLLTQLNLTERARLIGEADFLKGNDAIIFTEAFTSNIGIVEWGGDIIKEAVKKEYPFQTPVLGESREGWRRDDNAGDFRPIDFLGGVGGGLSLIFNGPPFPYATMSGGVFIASRHEIVEQKQHIYPPGCGFDRLSNKGFVYAKINKDGEFMHVIGTHMQSEDSMCSDGEPRKIRTSQIEAIKTFLRDEGIPETEVVFIGGDFNIDRGTEEYEWLFSIDEAVPGSLGVEKPLYAGSGVTYDTKNNGLARAQAPYRENRETGEVVNSTEYLDYIFVSRNHKRLPVWHNQSLDVPSPRWRAYDGIQNKTWYFQDYSDHYPVSAFVYADESTPTRSYKSTNGHYGKVQFKSLATGRYLRSAGLGNKLYADGRADEGNTKFTIANQNYVVSDCVHGEVGAADYVTVASNYYPDGYMGWNNAKGIDRVDLLDFVSQETLAIRLTDEPAWNLRLEFGPNQDGCIGNGDIVYFMDYLYFYQSVLRGPGNYYFDIWTDHEDQLYLWSGSPEDGFEVIMDPEPDYDDWVDRLQY